MRRTPVSPIPCAATNAKCAKLGFDASRRRTPSLVPHPLCPRRVGDEERAAGHSHQLLEDELVRGQEGLLFVGEVGVEDSRVRRRPRRRSLRPPRRSRRVPWSPLRSRTRSAHAGSRQRRPLVAGGGRAGARAGRTCVRAMPRRGVRLARRRAAARAGSRVARRSYRSPPRRVAPGRQPGGCARVVAGPIPIDASRRRAESSPARPAGRRRRAPAPIHLRPHREGHPSEDRAERVLPGPPAGHGASGRRTRRASRSRARRPRGSPRERSGPGGRARSAPAAARRRDPRALGVRRSKHASLSSKSS